MNYKGLTKGLIKKVREQKEAIVILEVELMDAEAQLEDREIDPETIGKIVCLTCRSEHKPEFLNRNERISIGFLSDEELTCPECGSQDTEIISAERRN